jgi:AcrR family transcriptional regulator
MVETARRTRRTRRTDPDKPGGRERIFAAALETLERDGEAALRFTDIAERAGVALSVITHHFATREGLVAALHAHRYAGLVESDLEVLRGLVATVRDRAGAAAGIEAVTRAIVDVARADVRLARIVSIGATHGRPDLAATVRRTATELLDALTDIIIASQRNGQLDPKVDARALATFLQAYAVGMVVADLDEEPVPRERILAVITRALSVFEVDTES